MIINRYRHHFFSSFLTDNVGVKKFFDLLRFSKLELRRQITAIALLRLFNNNTMCLLNTSIADVSIQSGY